MSRATARQAVQAEPDNRYIPQVLILVRRGLTDDTATMVYPWEVPILEVIHGEGNVREAEGPETAKWLRMTGVNQPADTVTELHGGGVKTAQAYDPSLDITAEYGRMEQKYGRHAEMPQSNVENVYGPLKNGQFEAAVLENLPDDLREGRVARILMESGASQLSGAQVRTALDQRKIKFRRASNLTALRNLLDDALEKERARMVDQDEPEAA